MEKNESVHTTVSQPKLNPQAIETYSSIIETKNLAVQAFLGDASYQNPSYIDFHTWYHPDVCHYLLQLVPNQAKCIRVIFSDADYGNNTQTFKYQLQQLIMLGNALQRPAIFVSKESGAENHYVCGLVKENKLLLINPLGITTKSDCYQTISELKKEKTISEVWLASNSLQKNEYEKEGLVSCGAIMLELATHILSQFTPEALESFWSQLKTNEPATHLHSGLNYHGMSIKDLLPETLKILENANDANTYINQACDIRKKHLQQLKILPVKQAQAKNMTTEEYLKNCKDNALPQFLFIKLVRKDNDIANIVELPEYKCLQEELNKQVNFAPALQFKDFMVAQDSPHKNSIFMSNLIDDLEYSLKNRLYHRLLGNIKLLIPFLSYLPNYANILIIFQEALICLDKQAQEFHYRDFLHKQCINILKLYINTLDYENITANLYEKIPPSDHARIRYKPFGFTFNYFYNKSCDDPTKELRQQRSLLIAFLEKDIEKNKNIVWGEWLFSYLSAQLQAGCPISLHQLTSVLSLLNKLIHKALYENADFLWPEILLAQRLLNDELATQALDSLSENELFDWWKQHESESCLMLIVQYYAKRILDSNDKGDKKFRILEQLYANQIVGIRRMKFMDSLNSIVQPFKSLIDLRKVFLNVPIIEIANAQKSFTTETIQILEHLLQQVASLLETAPCDFALCALGSTSRQDRRPYSDIELILLYEANTPITAAHLQTYLYYLVLGLEIAIKQLGETPDETRAPTFDIKGAQNGGFRIDSSSHLLKKNLIGTPEDFFLQNVINLPSHWIDEGHPWLHDESFYSILYPELINSSDFNGKNVIAKYKILIKNYLDAKPKEQDNIFLLEKVLNLKTKTSWHDISRRKLIAWSCLIDIVNKSTNIFINLKPGDTIDIKRVFYKPLTFLALNLKLMENIWPGHPTDIIAHAVTKLPWGRDLVKNLLLSALNFINQLQIKLHLYAGYQEEELKWLDTRTSNSSKFIVEAADYATLDLIARGIILPLKTWLDLNKAKICLISNSLHVIAKSYLAQRNYNWFYSWNQHKSHSVNTFELFNTHLINITNDYPSPDGWSPQYQLKQQQKLQKLNHFVQKETTICEIQGLVNSINTKFNSVYLKQELLKVCFDDRGNFVGDTNYSSHKSQVKKIAWDNQTYFFKLKEGNKEGLMGRELAVEHLHQLLGGSCQVAAGWPLKFLYRSLQGEKIYYIWISEAVEGDSLADVMNNKVPEITDWRTFKFDKESFSQLMLLAYLTYPEDGQPENFKVCKDKIKIIDNGQCFVSPTREEKNKTILNVKTMIYLLPQIQDPLDTKVLLRYRLLNIDKMYNRWKEQIRFINQIFKPLLEKDLERTKVKPSEFYKYNLLIDIDEQVQLCVKQRIESLQDYLINNITLPLTGLDILSALDPIVSISYQSLFNKIKKPEDYYAIDPQAYVKHPKTGKMYSSTSFELLKKNQLTPAKLQASINLHPSYFMIIDFNALRTSDGKKDYIKQRFVLDLLKSAVKNSLYGSKFTVLNLSGCEVIYEDELVELLQQLPNLQKLNIANCHQFNLWTILSLLSKQIDRQLIGVQWSFNVICPNLQQISFSYKLQEKNIILQPDIINRKQLTKTFKEYKQQLKNIITVLKEKYNHKDESVALILVRSLAQGIHLLSLSEQKKFIDEFLNSFEKSDEFSRANTIQLLSYFFKNNTNLLFSVKERVKQMVFKAFEESDKILISLLKSLNSMSKFVQNLTFEEQKFIINKLLANYQNDSVIIHINTTKTFGKLSCLVLNSSLEQKKVIILALLHELKHIDRDVREAAINALEFLIHVIMTLSYSTQNNIINIFLKHLDDNYIAVRKGIENILKKYTKLTIADSNYKIIELLISAIDEKNSWFIIVSITKILSQLNGLVFTLSDSQQMNLALIFQKILMNNNWYLKDNAPQVLGQMISTLDLQIKRNILNIPLSSLDDHNVNRRTGAVILLGQVSNLITILTPNSQLKFLSVLLDSLKNSDELLHKRIIQILGKLTSLLEVINSLQREEFFNIIHIALNENKSLLIKKTAIKALGKLPNIFCLLPSKLQVHLTSALFKLLCDKSDYIRQITIETVVLLAKVIKQFSFEEKYELMNYLLTVMLNDEYLFRRRNAPQGLGQLLNILLTQSLKQQSELIASLLKALVHENYFVNQSAAQALGPIARIIQNFPFIQVGQLMDGILDNFIKNSHTIEKISDIGLEGCLKVLSVTQQVEIINTLTKSLNQTKSPQESILREAAEALGLLFSDSIVMGKINYWLSNNNEDISKINLLQFDLIKNIFELLDNKFLQTTIPFVCKDWCQYRDAFFKFRNQQKVAFEAQTVIDDNEVDIDIKHTFCF